MSPSTRWILHLTNATSSADRTPCPDVDMIFFMYQIFSFSNHFQFLCFWTDSLHYFSTYYTMQYENWKKHRCFGFNGVYLVNLACPDVAMLFSCVNASHLACFSNFLVSRPNHYIIFQRIILRSIIIGKIIEVMV